MSRNRNGMLNFVHIYWTTHSFVDTEAFLLLHFAHRVQDEPRCAENKPTVMFGLYLRHEILMLGLKAQRRPDRSLFRVSVWGTWTRVSLGPDAIEHGERRVSVGQPQAPPESFVWKRHTASPLRPSDRQRFLISTVVHSIFSTSTQEKWQPCD